MFETHYFVTGSYGVLSNKGEVSFSFRKKVSLQHDGTPEGESEELHRLIESLEKEAIAQHGQHWRAQGFTDSDARWQLLTITPLATSRRSEP
ncbi:MULTISPECIES: hypothetical protein [unclassified Leptolyngbya]|uniref:hypothetical protein n=1 Tax=unclassified Leptolyngbya TaxID=2650499 RepID=UPI00168370F1|nr:MULTISPECIES: hypothetical protein [unclassified Leptolyngbya]MBD1912856.1 hypothetical protein [Leptolyngbya sp. FACHB-8]MBD2153965.1 hypothetical protein [Leptolyngbya sp. FACHB-16]